LIKEDHWETLLVRFISWIIIWIPYKNEWHVESWRDYLCHACWLYAIPWSKERSAEADWICWIQFFTSSLV
jgi:hypothetical protein